MLSPGHSRASSCSLTQGDGPDFLNFAVNQLSVDDESECMFPMVNEKKFGDCLVNAKERDGVKKVVENLEKKGSRNLTQLQCEEDESNSEEKRNAEKRSGNERKSISGLSSSYGEEAAAKNLSKSKVIKETSGLKIEEKIPKARTHFRELEAVTKSAAVWKSHVFTDRFSVGMELSQGRNKRHSVRKRTWHLLRNLPQSKAHNFSKSQTRMGFHDIATNFYDLKRESKIKSLDNRRNFSLAERSGAKWLQKTVRPNKTELPPINLASTRNYSTQWMPKKSIPSHSEVDLVNEYSRFERSARKQPDLKTVVLKSVLQALETTQLGGKSRADFVKHSISSLEHNNNRERFKKKALPVVKSALAFKHPSSKSA